MAGETVSRDDLKRARGVLPYPSRDPVLPNPNATGQFVFISLRPELDEATVRSFLATVQDATEQLRAQKFGPDRVATVATGFSGTFFTKPDGTTRFANVSHVPAGLRTPPVVDGSQGVPADMVFYVVSTSEGCAARFIARVATDPAVAAVALERGYQRPNHDEPFGYRDGVRNIEEKRQRPDVVFIDQDQLPEEPWWAHDGTYLAYLKIQQDVAAMAAMPAAEQDAIIGRTKEGRRLDQAPQERVNARTEGPFTGDLPPVDSHVRKSGPRGEFHDAVRIFRRGLPYFEPDAAGHLVQGLHFASFQSTLDAFDVIFNRWMVNPAFPRGGPNQPDRLLRLVKVNRHGFFFVPPDTTDHPAGDIMFMPSPKSRKPKTGRVAVRKKLLDGSTAGPHKGELSGFTFALFDTATNAQVGGTFATDGKGHALSDEVPLGQFVLREVAGAEGIPAGPDKAITLSSAREVVQFENTVPPTTTY
ncbi:Dyp-type peroxidase [Pedococcus sp. P5_B7]